MRTLTQTELDLLTLTTPDSGAIPEPEQAKAGKALIRLGLVMALPQPEGPSRLLITSQGRAVLSEAGIDLPTGAPAGGVEETNEAAKAEILDPVREVGAPDERNEAGEGVEGEAPPPVLTIAKGKLGAMVALLQRSEGAKLEEMMQATGWQKHSVRGAMSGSLKKKLGLVIHSTKTDGVRVYRIEADEVVEADA